MQGWGVAREGVLDWGEIKSATSGSPFWALPSGLQALGSRHTVEEPASSGNTTTAPQGAVTWERSRATFTWCLPSGSFLRQWEDKTNPEEKLLCVPMLDAPPFILAKLL